MFSKVTKNWRNRVASMGGARVDLHEADVAVLDRNTARLLVGFNAELGAPKTSEIDHFVRAGFSGKVVPVLESVQVHDEEGALHLLVTLDRPVVSLAEAGKRGFVQVNPMLFRQASSGEAWSVFDSADGPMIVREADDDIGEIMAERAERRLEAGAGPLLLFSSLRTASRSNPMPGDEFEFYYQGQIMDGTVSSVSADRSLTIKAFDGGSYTIPHEALGRMKKLGPQSISAIQTKTQQYFSQVFPADPTMAREISQVKPPAPGQIPEPSTSDVPSDMPLPRGARFVTAADQMDPAGLEDEIGDIIMDWRQAHGVHMPISANDVLRELDKRARVGRWTYDRGAAQQMAQKLTRNGMISVVTASAAGVPVTASVREAGVARGRAAVRNMLFGGR